MSLNMNMHWCNHAFEYGCYGDPTMWGHAWLNDLNIWRVMNLRNMMWLLDDEPVDDNACCHELDDMDVWDDVCHVMYPRLRYHVERERDRESMHD